MPSTTHHPWPSSGPPNYGDSRSAAAVGRILAGLPASGSPRKRARWAIGFLFRFCTWLGTSTSFTRDLLISALICRSRGAVDGPDEGGGEAQSGVLPPSLLTYLRNTPGLRRVGLIVSQYKETWNGTGSPAAKRGEELELGVCIIHVAEAFGRLTYSRAGADGPPEPSDALKQLRDMGGDRLHPEMTAEFAAMVESEWTDMAAAIVDGVSLVSDGFIEELLDVVRGAFKGSRKSLQWQEGPFWMDASFPKVGGRWGASVIREGAYAAAGPSGDGADGAPVTPHLAHLLGCILRKLWHSTGYRCWISLPFHGKGGRGSGRDLRLAAVKGIPRRYLGRSVLPGCPDEKVLLTGEPLVRRAVWNAARASVEGRPSADGDPPGEMCWIYSIPIGAGENPFGVLSVAAPREGLPLGEQNLVRFAAGAAEAAIRGDRQREYLDHAAAHMARLRTLKAQLLDKKRYGMMIIDAAGNIEYFNSRAEEIFSWIGVGRPMRGQPFSELGDVLGLSEEVASLLRTKGPETEISGRAVVRGGRRRVFETGVFAVSGRDGAAEAAVVGIRDITHRHELEDMLQRDQGLIALGQLAAGAIHEIRNPLTAIKGLLQLLREDSGPPAGQLELAIEEVARVESLVDDLLVLGKPLHLAAERQDVNVVVRRAAELLENQAEKFGCCMELDLDGSPLWAAIDEDKILQVLYNLGQNALAAMAETEGTRVLTLSTRLNRRKTRVVIGVADTGEGMSEETKGSIFNPFFTTRPGGLGLGLTVSLRIIEAHGGEMRVHTDSGWGTLIHIYLPT